jgi:hypothetical protein
MIAMLGCSPASHRDVVTAPAGDVNADATPDEPLPPQPLPLGASGVVTEPHTVYDRSGNVIGRRDSRGYFFAGNGAYAGRRDSMGNFFAKTGALAGRVDSAHNYYDATGRYAGRRNDDGSYFDQHGAYDGRIDVSGNLYDKNGAYVGHADGNCDDSCKQDLVARTLLSR